ncbi:MAG TPA: hypothetical protein VFA05_05125 [Gaiellaceae bacterium]|nr:hypothetical protein [Gaiellaceae bacterium]
MERAVASGRDVWGGQLLRARGGPTYPQARNFLTPPTQALQWGGRPLTPSGSYYLPFSFPFTPYGSTVFALHVADGSEILTRAIGGPSLQIYVGDGRERYGSCAARLAPAQLAEGWLPILQTSYTDAAGVKYREESFVGRAYGAYGAPSVISFLRLTVDATDATRGATVRLVPWRLLAHSAADRLALKGQTRLIVSDGAQFVDGVVRYSVAPGGVQTIYADWLNAPSNAQYVHANEQSYATARATVVGFWEQRLGDGASFTVPEPVVQDAMQGVLTQLISYGWRYSVGNPYEELSFAESLDAAEVAAEYGYAAVAKSVIQLALQRIRQHPWRFTAFRGAHILSTAALYYRLTHDRAFLHAETPALGLLVQRIAARQIHGGPDGGRLLPEPLSTDLEAQAVDSVPGQVDAVQALRAIGRVWGGTGYPGWAARAERLAASLAAALRPAVMRASVRMRDGSVFVPDQLTTRQRPFRRITASRAGSYWNLVMPYAFGSGYWAPHSGGARGIIRYLLSHGARLLGVPRTYARTIYGTNAGAGLAPVYELGISRFLADNDEPDQLVLSLYGLLAAGMAQGTYVSGEAVSLLPLRGEYARAMFMPPNSGANASYLGTLRELLVHERRNPLGAPAGLDLAFSTPRAWLASGREIDVRSAPTSFGKVTYTIVRDGDAIEARLVLPPHAHPRLRLRLPAGQRLAHVVVGTSIVAADRAGTIDLGDRQGSVVVRATVG